MSDVYPNDIVTEHENNNADREINQTILRAYINNCVGNILLDSGARMSLINEIFIQRNKNKLGNTNVSGC